MTAPRSPASRGFILGFAGHLAGNRLDVIAPKPPVPAEGGQAWEQAPRRPPADRAWRDVEDTSHLRRSEVVAVADVVQERSPEGRPASCMRHDSRKFGHFLQTA
jgi:hypothetical protein